MTRKPDYNNYTLLDQDQLIGTYQNPYAVPIGFLSPESGMKQNEIAKSPITYQNEIAHRLDPKINNLFEPAKYTDIRYNNIQPISQLNNAVLKKKNLLEMSYIIFTVPIEKNTSYYMTLGTEINKGNISISVDGQAQTQFTPSEKTIIANIATGTTINTTANVQIFVNKNNALLQDVKLYKVHNSKIAQFSKDLNSHPYKVTKWNDHQLTGTVDVKSNNQSLTTTIPFEKGWHATVMVSRLSLSNGQKCLPIFQLAKAIIRLSLLTGRRDYLRESGSLSSVCVHWNRVLLEETAQRKSTHKTNTVGFKISLSS